MTLLVFGIWCAYALHSEQDESETARKEPEHDVKAEASLVGRGHQIDFDEQTSAASRPAAQ